jgi:hypothetical protein
MFSLPDRQFAIMNPPTLRGALSGEGVSCRRLTSFLGVCIFVQIQVEQERRGIEASPLRRVIIFEEGIHVG